MVRDANSLNIAIKKGTANIDSIDAIINKCLFSKADIFTIVPAKTIVSELQIINAIEKAFETFASKKMLAKSSSLEFLLFLYGTRKIDEALRLVSFKDKHYFLIIASKSKDRLKKMLNCALKNGFKEKEFALKPNIKELTTLYNINWLHAYKGIKKSEALQLAILEKQALSRIIE